MIIDIKTNKDINNKKQNLQKGFTLIEVMVSVSLFAMVMTLSLGAILSIVDGNKKAQAVNSVANNLNFAVESMVRDIKTGYAYTCNNDITTATIPEASSTSNISSTQNNCTPAIPFHSLSLVSTITGTKRGVMYSRIEDTTTGKGRIYKTSTDNTTINYPITSPEVDIKQMSFYVDNPVTDTYTGQPKVFLVIKGTANINATEISDFTIQTLISQRNLNLPK